MVNNDRDKAAEQLNIFKEAAAKVGVPCGRDSEQMTGAEVGTAGQL